MTSETKRSDDIRETPEAPQQLGLPWKSDAQLSASGSTFSAKAKDLGALRDAVVDAAQPLERVLTDCLKLVHRWR